MSLVKNASLFSYLESEMSETNSFNPTEIIISTNMITNAIWFFLNFVKAKKIPKYNKGIIINGKKNMNESDSDAVTVK